MRKSLMFTAALIAFGTLGCGSDQAKPVQVTPEMEAEQRQAEKDVNRAEAEMRKQQKPQKTDEQRVDEEERARLRPRN